MRWYFVEGRVLMTVIVMVAWDGTDLITHCLSQVFDLGQSTKAICQHISRPSSGDRGTETHRTETGLTCASLCSLQTKMDASLPPACQNTFS